MAKQVLRTLLEKRARAIRIRGGGTTPSGSRRLAPPVPPLSSGAGAAALRRGRSGDAQDTTVDVRDLEAEIAGAATRTSNDTPSSSTTVGPTRVSRRALSSDGPDRVAVSTREFNRMLQQPYGFYRPNPGARPAFSDPQSRAGSFRPIGAADTVGQDLARVGRQAVHSLGRMSPIAGPGAAAAGGYALEKRNSYRTAGASALSKMAVEVEEAHSLLSRQPGEPAMHPAFNTVTGMMDRPLDRAMAEDVLKNIKGYESVDEGGIPLRVNIGRDRPLSDAIRTFKNERIPLIQRIVAGTARTAVSPLTGLISSTVGEVDPQGKYDPLAHSITVSGGGPATLLHELGHAVDIPDRPSGAMSHYGFDPAGYEVRATRYANKWLTEYARAKKMSPKGVEELRRGLDAAFDTYAQFARIGPSAFDSLEEYDQFRKKLLRKAIDRETPTVADREFLIDIVEELGFEDEMNKQMDKEFERERKRRGKEKEKEDEKPMRKAASQPSAAHYIGARAALTGGALGTISGLMEASLGGGTLRDRIRRGLANFFVGAGVGAAVGAGVGTLRYQQAVRDHSRREHHQRMLGF